MVDSGFTAAIRATADLIGSLKSREPTTDEIEKLHELTNSVETSRGFFVALLTGDSTIADDPPPYLVAVLRDSAKISCDLLVKNLVMSTTMGITHKRNGDLQQAAGSLLVSNRSTLLISKIELPEMQRRLFEMIEAIEHKLSAASAENSYYTRFLERLSYDQEQLRSAREAVQKLYTKRPQSEVD